MKHYAVEGAGGQTLPTKFCGEGPPEETHYNHCGFVHQLICQNIINHLKTKPWWLRSLARYNHER